MATFVRPTFTQILNSIQADITSRLPSTDSTLRRSVLNVLSYVIAGVAYGLYGFISYLALQIFPDTAETYFLNRWGAIWGVQRVAANFAEGNLIITGTIDGTDIPIGTQLQRSDGALFVTMTDGVLSSGTVTVQLEAIVAGSAGNTSANAPMNFVTPIANVNSAAAVDSNGLNGGTDLQSDAAYLQAILNRIQTPPQGGDAADYVTWALNYPGGVVTRAWVYPQELGIGTVSVRFMMDNTYTNGIPQSADVTNLNTYMQALRPVTAALTVVAPIASAINFNIHLNVNDTPAIRSAVIANLTDQILQDSQPGGTIYLSRINEAISLATGQYDHVLNSPNANITNTTGYISTMGTVTFV